MIELLLIIYENGETSQPHVGYIYTVRRIGIEMRVDKNANRVRGPRKSALWCHRICDRAYFPQISKPFHKFQLICTRAQKDAVISHNKQTQGRKTSQSYDGGQRRIEQFKKKTATFVK